MLVIIESVPESWTLIGLLQDNVLLSIEHTPLQLKSAPSIEPELESKFPLISIRYEASPSSIFKTPLLCCHSSASRVYITPLLSNA